MGKDVSSEIPSTQISEDEIKSRGEGLFEKIQEIYKYMPTKEEKSSIIPTIGLGEAVNDISIYAEYFIPENISFDDAESILRYAGFNVEHRRVNPILSDFYPEKYNVFAQLETETKNPDARMRVVAVLTPNKPGSYAFLGKLMVTIEKFNR